MEMRFSSARASHLCAWLSLYLENVPKHAFSFNYEGFWHAQCMEALKSAFFLQRCRFER